MKDKLFAEEINDVIKAVVEEYAALPYIREQLSDIQFVISDQLFLDVLSMKIRSKTISYAAMKKRLDEKNEKDLENSMQSLEAKIDLTENEKKKVRAGQAGASCDQRQEKGRSPASLESEMDCRR